MKSGLPYQLWNYLDEALFLAFLIATIEVLFRFLKSSLVQTILETEGLSAVSSKPRGDSQGSPRPRHPSLEVRKSNLPALANNFQLEEFFMQIYFSALALPRTMYDPFFAILVLLFRLPFFPISRQLPKTWNRIYFVLLCGVVGFALSRLNLAQLTREYMRGAYCFPDSKLNYFMLWIVGGTAFYQIGQFFSH